MYGGLPKYTKGYVLALGRQYKSIDTRHLRLKGSGFLLRSAQFRELTSYNQGLTSSNIEYDM